MADPEHESILGNGKREWNRWRRAHPDVIPDLSRETPEDDLEGDLATIVAAVLYQVAPGRARDGDRIACRHPELGFILSASHGA